MNMMTDQIVTRWTGRMRAGVFLIAMTACVSLVSAQTSLDLRLEDAIRIGKENSKLLRISEAKVDAASGRAEEAGAALLPTLKLEAGYRRFSDVDPFVIQLPFLPTPVEIAPTVLNNYNLRVGLQQPLFTGFKLRNAARSSDLLARASTFDNSGDKADVVLAIATAYWTLYQARAAQQYADENVVRLERFLLDAQNLVKAGSATRNDELRIGVQLDNAKLSQIDAANDAQVGAMNLNNAMGQPLDMEVHLISVPGKMFATDSSATFPMTGTATELVATAHAARPEILALSSRVEASKAGVGVAEGSWWPQLFLTGNYYYSRPNPRYQPTLDEFKSTWDIGVQLQFDIWTWGTTHYQTQQATAVLKQNEFLLDQMKDNVTVDVRRSMLFLRRARDKVVLAARSLDQAEENLRSTSEKFKTGLASSADLLDADLTLRLAKTMVTGAMVEEEISGARLRRALGGY